jgi:hypothetical protein
MWHPWKSNRLFKWEQLAMGIIQTKINIIMNLDDLIRTAKDVQVMNARSVGFQCVRNARNSFITEKYVSLRRETFEIWGSRSSDDSDSRWVQYQRFEEAFCHHLQGWDSMLLWNMNIRMKCEVAILIQLLGLICLHSESILLMVHKALKWYMICLHFQSLLQIVHKALNWYTVFKVYIRHKLCRWSAN